MTMTVDTRCESIQQLPRVGTLAGLFVDRVKPPQRTHKKGRAPGSEARPEFDQTTLDSNHPAPADCGLHLTCR